jgi:hypothetical protein
VKWVRDHSLVLIVAFLGTIGLAIFTWAEYGYFCDQAESHQEQCESFWSSAHIHDWTYNAFSNYQSELLFGILVIVLLKRLASAQDHEKDEA